MSFFVSLSSLQQTTSKKKKPKTHRDGLPGVLHPDPAHQQQVRQGPPPIQGVGRQEEVEGEQDDVELDLSRFFLN